MRRTRWRGCRPGSPASWAPPQTLCWAAPAGLPRSWRSPPRLQSGGGQLSRPRRTTGRCARPSLLAAASRSFEARSGPTHTHSWAGRQKPCSHGRMRPAKPEGRWCCLEWRGFSGLLEAPARTVCKAFFQGGRATFQIFLSFRSACPPHPWHKDDD